MLEVGVHDSEGYPGLTLDETRAHFSMWALMAAPLIAGNDVTAMGAPTREVLLNHEVIALDQDPAGKQGKPGRDEGDQEVWAKELADGSTAVALFNRGEAPAPMSISATDAGLPEASEYAVRDLWAHRDTTSSGELRSVVPAHGVTLLRVRPQN